MKIDMKWLYIATGCAFASIIYLSQGNFLAQEQNAKLVGTIKGGQLAGIQLQNLPAKMNPGMVVAVEASLHEGGKRALVKQATPLVELKGVVISNDMELDQSINILGQKVTLHRDYVLKSFDQYINSPKNIPIGSYVHVSGYASGRGSIHATRLDIIDARYEAKYELQISGYVENLETESFTIGDLTVNFKAWQENYSREIESNQFVIVRSHIKPQIYDPANPSLIAMEVDQYANKSALFGTPGKMVKFEGLVAQVSTEKKEFMVNGITVRLENHQDMSELQGRQISIEGKIDDDGSILAHKIHLMELANNHLLGTIFPS